MAEVRLSYELDITQESKWLTLVASPMARAGLAYVQEIGDFRCGPGYYTTRADLPSYLIKLCIGGAGLLSYEGKQYRIGPGTVFWIDCMKEQDYRTDPEVGSWDLLWIHLYGATTRAYHELFLQQNEQSPIVAFGQPATVRGIFDMLMKLYDRGGNTLSDDIQASSLLTQLMVRCIDAANVNRAGGRLPDYVMDARSYIRQHYAEPIALEDLGRLFSVNKFYLQKQFKRYTGMSPNEYLTHTRLTNAKRLLNTTDRPIAQIAEEVGFGNIGHFITMFGRYEGVSPRVYRQRWFKKDIEDETEESS